MQRVQRSAGAVERMFGGNPVRNSLTLYSNYDKEPFKQKVRDFLALGDAKL